VRKTKCKDVAPAIARLLLATQRIAAQDWAGLPSDADVTRCGISRDVLVAYLFQLSTPGLAACSSAAQRLHEQAGERCACSLFHPPPHRVRQSAADAVSVAGRTVHMMTYVQETAQKSSRGGGASPH
jgi:hypothetical protein